jgi:hypothetical protein
MVCQWWIGREWDGSSHGVSEILELSSVTEGKHEKESGSVSHLRLEMGIS